MCIDGSTNIFFFFFDDVIHCGVPSIVACSLHSSITSASRVISATSTSQYSSIVYRLMTPVTILLSIRTESNKEEETNTRNETCQHLIHR
jgi:hypothetical protein